MRAAVKKIFRLILCILLFAGFSGLRYNRVDKVVVKKVESGDTIVVTWRGKDQAARLIGIDAPDKGQPFYEDSRKALESLIKGGKIGIRFDNKYNRPEEDSAKRWVCIAFVDKTCLNEEMVRLGYARADAMLKCESLKSLAYLEACARRGKLGVWSAVQDGDSAVGRIDIYVGWKHDDIYHRAGCRILDKYKPEDIIVFSTREEAGEGRKPCPVCIGGRESQK